MSAEICPTITAVDAVDYKHQLNRILPFAKRIHIDLMDGIFASPKSVGIDQLYWPANIAIDIHLMHQQPFQHAEALVALSPRLVIVHAESDGSFEQFAEFLHSHGIEVGVALMPETPVGALEPALDIIDHVLLFSGHLGHTGGQADLHFLIKAQQLRALKPSLEIGWDGGVNATNVRSLEAGGIEVLNVGGFIQQADNPVTAYATLESLL